MDPNTPLQPYVPPAGTPQSTAAPLQPIAPVGQSMATQPTAPIGIPATQPTPSASSVGTVSPPPFAPLPPVGGTGTDVGAAIPEVPGAAGPKEEIIDKLRQANNVLVTVSNNPSVDQLSAAIGLTILLNKLGKHATAVFSGNVPSTLEFLQPEKTIEKNTDSLRDFIIALDKAKADKLRYKVEDKFVKIFITPYHTSLTSDDLEFSQGDFNVDIVMALGVHQQQELDQAITAHGRILHDAVVACVNNKQAAQLGTINWYEATASSLCEMLVGLIEPLQGNQTLLDEQIATAFLTGVVAETERFSNDKTTPHTMNISATLMKAGANQQLVASKLQQPMPLSQTGSGIKIADASTQPAKPADGSLAIEHKADEKPAESAPSKTLTDLEQENAQKDSDATGDDALDKIHIDDNGQLQRIAELEEQKAENDKKPNEVKASNMILTPPTLGSALSANTVPESSPPPVNPLTAPATPAPSEDSGAMQHGKSIQPLSETNNSQTLSQIEEAVESPHIAQAVTAPPPITPAAPTALPSQLVPPDPGLPPDPTAASSSPSAPPPVPPPLIPPDAE